MSCCVLTPPNHARDQMELESLIETEKRGGPSTSSSGGPGDEDNGEQGGLHRKPSSGLTGPGSQDANNSNRGPIAKRRTLT